MRAQRLLSILMQLQVNRRMTARDLAGKLEVSERTILRDMDALSSSGVPVVADRGAGGGWSLLAEYETKLTGLSPEEIQSLFVSRAPNSPPIWVSSEHPRTHGPSSRSPLRPPRARQAT